MAVLSTAPHRFVEVPEAFESVQTVRAAVERLTRGDRDIAILAGGTDLILQGQRGEVTPRVLLHVGGIDELRSIEQAEDVVRIGALVTHSQLQRHELVRERYLALHEAAGTVGGWQTQNVGTLMGNLCNASPAADTIPALLIADARVELISARGTRVVAVEDFVLGRRSIDRRPDELATVIELPHPSPRCGEAYLKVAPRSAMEVALVGLALRLCQDADGAVADVRIALCAVGPRPFRLRAAERILVDGDAGRDAVLAAGEVLAAAAAPIDDARASARYRRRILPGLLDRAVEVCRTRAML